MNYTYMSNLLFNFQAFWHQKNNFFIEICKKKTKIYQRLYKLLYLFFSWLLKKILRISNFDLFKVPTKSDFLPEITIEVDDQRVFWKMWFQTKTK